MNMLKQILDFLFLQSDEYKLMIKILHNCRKKIYKDPVKKFLRKIKDNRIEESSYGNKIR